MDKRPTRISGADLRTPIVLHPSLGNTGDGTDFGPDRPLRAQVKQRTALTSDSAGTTLTVWAVALIRPTVKLSLGPGAGARPPAPGDEATIGGVRRRIASVEPVPGRGTAVAAYQLTAGDGSGRGYSGGST